MDEQVKLHIESGEWLIKETNSVIKQYKACKTGYCRRKLLCKIEHLMNRLDFQYRELDKIL